MLARIRRGPMRPVYGPDGPDNDGRAELAAAARISTTKLARTRPR